MVFVTVIRAEATPQAIAPAIHRILWKREFNMKSLVIPTPERAERKWPIMRLRGWARGDSMALYSRIATAPYIVYESALILGNPKDTYKASNQGRWDMCVDGVTLEGSPNGDEVGEGSKKCPCCNGKISNLFWRLVSMTQET